MSQYRYQHLRDAGSIRVFTIDPVEANGCERISITLSAIRLSDKQEYQALSYTWGSLNDTVPISIGDSTLNITTSLYAFLCRSRNLEGNLGEHPYFWADQICINQGDLKERNQQVGIMKDIYRLSRRTLVWLGEMSEDSRAYLLLSNIDKSSIIKETHRPKAMDDSLTVFEDHLTSSKDGDIMASLLDIMNRPWFSRSWIIQEVVLCRECLVLIGHTSFSWRALYMLMQAVVLWEKRQLGNIRNCQILKTPAAQTLRHVEVCRGEQMSYADTSPAQHTDFLDILRRLSVALLATDPRDHVYAFLSLQVGGDVLPPADYGLTVDQVYMSTSEYLANSSKSLAILADTRSPTQVIGSNLPSWAIDWRINKRPQGFPIADKNSTFAASGIFRHQGNNTDNDNLSRILKVRGKVVGVVEILSTDDNIIPDDISSAIQYLANPHLFLVYPLRSYAINHGCNTDDLDRRIRNVVLMHDKGRDKNDQWERLASALQAYKQNDAIQASLLHRDVWFSERLASARKRTKSKRLFISKEQHAWGVAPKLARRGDLCCILHGSSVPIILRRSLYMRGRYTVIGQCYFENWMHGQHVKWSENEADTFELE